MWSCFIFSGVKRSLLFIWLRKMYRFPFTTFCPKCRTDFVLRHIMCIFMQMRVKWRRHLKGKCWIDERSECTREWNRWELAFREGKDCGQGHQAIYQRLRTLWSKTAAGMLMLLSPLGMSLFFLMSEHEVTSWMWWSRCSEKILPFLFPLGTVQQSILTILFY